MKISVFSITNRKVFLFTFIFFCGLFSTLHAVQPQKVAGSSSAALEVFEILATGDYQKLSFALKSNPEVLNFADEEGAFPIHIAAFNGNLKDLQLILGYGDNVDKIDGQNWTPLHFAVAGKRMKNVAFLLVRGANPNRSDKNGNTPLFFAVANSQSGMVKVLMNYGADALIRNNSGEQPIDWARTVDFKKYCKHLFDSANSSVQQQKVSKQNVYPEKTIVPNTTKQLSEPKEINTSSKKVFEILREDRFEEFQGIVSENPGYINSKDNEGATLLHAAAFLGKKTFAGYLLDSGLKIMEKDINGWTPLHYAVAGDQGDMVIFLAGNGADLYVRDPKAPSPLRLACMGSSRSMASALLKAVSFRRASPENPIKQTSSKPQSNRLMKTSWASEAPVTISVEKKPEIPEKAIRNENQRKDRKRKDSVMSVVLPVVLFTAFAVSNN
ncbi:MAG: ankyrin repeat domain-containing protein [Candidatus Riflebacteria bacterium]|nr:ankyrin repeat domain-containing protein [Candidatus Riflebacteria bacterium]